MCAFRAHVRLVELEAQLSEIYAQQQDHCFLLPVVSLITVNARTFTRMRRLSFFPVSTWSPPFATSSGRKLAGELILLTRSTTSYYHVSSWLPLTPEAAKAKH